MLTARRATAVLLAVATALALGCGDDSGGRPHAQTSSSESIPIDDVIKHIESRRARKERRQQREVERPAPDDAGKTQPTDHSSRPEIVQRPIPFPPSRKQAMAEYAQRHYGITDFHLTDPRVIVLHYTVTPTFQSTWNTFAGDVPDPELHERPGLCTHFVIDRDGTIYQLVPLTIMCRHTVGLNQVGVGIEHVGGSDEEVMGDQAQLQASLSLVHWLRCRFGIQQADVIGHNESLSSPYREEHVARLRSQTHQDFQASTMERYRELLQAGSDGC